MEGQFPRQQKLPECVPHHYLLNITTKDCGLKRSSYGPSVL